MRVFFQGCLIGDFNGDQKPNTWFRDVEMILKDKFKFKFRTFVGAQALLRAFRSFKHKSSFSRKNAREWLIEVQLNKQKEKWIRECHLNDIIPWMINHNNLQYTICDNYVPPMPPSPQDLNDSICVAVDAIIDDVVVLLYNKILTESNSGKYMEEITTRLRKRIVRAIDDEDSYNEKRQCL